MSDTPPENNTDSNNSRKKLKSSKIDSRAAEKAIHQALIHIAHQQEREVKNQIEALNSTLEEFMKCYVLIGYNIGGDPVMIMNAKTPQDADSLSTCITKWFLMHGPPSYPQE